eukprot:scaffold30050_cov63-Phaeocystis_antarctica.AAC.1
MWFCTVKPGQHFGGRTATARATPTRYGYQNGMAYGRRAPWSGRAPRTGPPAGLPLHRGVRSCTAEFLFSPWVFWRL